MQNQQTTGIKDTDGFLDIADQSNTTRSTYGSDNQGSDPHGFKHIPNLLQYLENHFIFSASLFSIVGYVLIASFGSMNSLGQYLGYIFFLSLIFSVVDLVKNNHKSKKINYGILLLSLLMFLIIIYQNRLFVYKVYGILNKPFVQNKDNTLQLKDVTATGSDVLLK